MNAQIPSDSFFAAWSGALAIRHGWSPSGSVQKIVSAAVIAAVLIVPAFVFG